MKLSSIGPILRLLWHGRKRWVVPPRAEILVFDRNGSEVFAGYLPAEPAILDVRGESINLPILLSTILRNGIGATMGTYAQEYVRFVNPRVVLTHIDNTLQFYRLKERQPALVTISVQNGIRDNVLFDILARESATGQRFRADHILCFGSAVAEKYAEHIDASVEPIGSFMNNSVPRRGGSAQPSLMFLSQFRVPHPAWKEPVMPVGERLIDWSLFYGSEAFLLPGLLAYCRRRNLPLTVCGCSIEDREREIAFFRGLLGEVGWEYLPRESLDASYKRIDEAHCVVFIDSTIGYEALARGARAAVFSLRGSATQSNDRGFGLSVRHPPTGPFWTTLPDLAEIDRILDYLLAAPDAEWERERDSYVAQIMAFDPGNTRFVELLAGYGVTRARNHQQDRNVQR